MGKEFTVALQEAKEGKAKVRIYIKGSRPMFRPDHPYGSNAFSVDSYEDLIPVPQMCEALGVDPGLVETIFFHYRQDERWPKHRGLPEGLKDEDEQKWKAEHDHEIAAERKQIITSLFPFPIEWMRENGATGEIYSLGIYFPLEAFDLNLDKVRESCNRGKAVEEEIIPKAP